MNSNDFIDDGANGFQLSGTESQAVASRQLAASLAVAIVMTLSIGMTLLMPASRDTALGPPHRVATVQQSKFVIPAEHVAAAIQFGIEVD